MHNSPQKIAVNNVSNHPKFGVKGAKAGEWLLAQKVKFPDQANSWQLWNENSLILRLGSSEFLIEDLPKGTHVALLTEAIQNESSHIYYVPRADAAFILTGDEALDLLSEICMLDLTNLANSNTLYMTQIAGISATILNNNGSYHIWCDGTYERYMQETLTTISLELNNRRELNNEALF